MLFSAFSLCQRHRWDLVHAVEESVFIAWLLNKCRGLPYIYDMDSSLPEQMLDRFRFLRPLESLARRCEKLAIRDSCGVITVCRALQQLVTRVSPTTRVVCVEDVSLATGNPISRNGQSRQSLLPELDGAIVMYVGNLQPYQGIDLLLESFSELVARQPTAHLVIVGGMPEDVAKYRRRAADLGVAERTHLLGMCRVNKLMHYLQRADVLVSPRLGGCNTPMKIFSYLDSGTPIVATRLVSHTQVLNDRVACLVEPNPHSMAEGLDRLLINPALRATLAQRARQHVQEEFSAEVAEKKLISFYGAVDRQLNPNAAARRPMLAR
jgi:glycosyltransferase involved in cell wall biosynthesis